MKNLFLLCSLAYALTSQAQMAAEMVSSIEAPAVYTAPAFPGGETSLFRFIAQEMDYPQLAREYNVEGTVVARLQLNPAGEIQSTTIVKSLGFGCDEAVLGIIAKMPQWLPARYGEKGAYGFVYLPIRFSLR